MGTIVRHVVDLNKLPPLTAKRKAELRTLAAMPDSDIDFSDIPPLDEEFWKRAVRNPFIRRDTTPAPCAMQSACARRHTNMNQPPPDPTGNQQPAPHQRS